LDPILRLTLDLGKGLIVKVLALIKGF